MTARKQGETAPNEALMHGKGPIHAERGVQPTFRIFLFIQSLVLFWLVIGGQYAIRHLPNRVELGPRVSQLRMEPAQLDGQGFAPFQLAGAWYLTSADPRFGGWSALMIDRGRLLALSDTGLVGWFPKPGAAAPTILMKELPDGPGDKSFRSNRDTEALAPDAAGRGWWVAYENRNELWLYDRNFTRALKRVQFGKRRWRPNRGIEGLAQSGADLLLVLERDPTIFRTHANISSAMRVEGKNGRFSEALRLPDGRLFAVEQTVSQTGLRNALVELRELPQGFGVAQRYPLGLGPFDNVEGMAAEQMPGGRIRLWLITDDNFQSPMRTLLLAIDLPPERPRRKAR